MAGDVEQGAGVLVAAQRLVGGLAGAGLGQHPAHMLDPGARRGWRPVQQREQRDRVLNRGARRRARPRRRPRTVALIVGGGCGVIGDLECGVVVGQRVLPVGEAFGVVECRDVRAACLVDRAQESLGAFFEDAGDPHRMCDHRPRIIRRAGSLGAHHVERRAGGFPGVQAVLMRQGRVLLRRVSHQFRGGGVVLPRTRPGVVEASQQRA